MNLSVSFAGLKLENPVMPASGPLTGDDRKMLAIHSQGVGAMVTKTISIEAAKVPRPCIVAGNNYVLNAELWSEYDWQSWHDEFIPRFRQESDKPLFVSLGYTKEDLEFLVPKFSDQADAFELSTHYVADDPSLLSDLIKTVKLHTDKPVFIKFDPSVPDPGEMAKAIESAGGDGIVAINSLGPVYPLNLLERSSPLGSEQGFGWISGPVIKPFALAMIRRIVSATRLPVVGTGGISSADDVLEFLMAGASAVQLLSSALIRGKQVFSKILNELPERIKACGGSGIEDLMGVALKNNTKESFKKRTPIVDHFKCIKCNLCAQICPYDALSLQDKIYVDESACFGCGLCESRCPVKAIEGVLF
ncbi:MAG TPA: dihydroorotate dehydrogenase [Kosmotogaceae bacterium]|nr:dihydroorotate dehydrogenase [Kosmotogaceae bacterium]